MALRVVRLSDLAIEVSGYPPSEAGRVLARARAAATLVQEQIADDFESEQAGGAYLLKNTRAYTVRKIIDGYDPRRGHRTGNLQRALWRPGLIKVDQQSNRTLLMLLRGTLLSRVAYSDHYADAKTRGGNLLSVYPALVSIVREEMAGIQTRRAEPGALVKKIAPRRGTFEVVADVLGAVFGRAV